MHCSVYIMVFEAIVQKILGKYFQIFLKNFNNDALSLKVLSGEVALENLGISFLYD